MMDLLRYLDARAGEASTWAAIAALLTALHVHVTSDTMQAITTWGVVGSALMGILLSEATAGKTSGQIAQDILKALIQLTNKGEKP